MPGNTAAAAWVTWVKSKPRRCRAMDGAIRCRSLCRRFRFAFSSMTASLEESAVTISIPNPAREPVGADYLGDETCRFRVWAPNLALVGVRLLSTDRIVP